MMKQTTTPCRLLLASILILLASFSGYTQTDPLFTQYYELPSYYNPASIGNTDNIRIRAGSRLQWLGIEGAPLTFMGVADMPVKLGTKRAGVGVMLQQESIGLYRNLNANVQAGYKFKAFKGVFTAAVSVGLVDRTFKGSEVYLPDDDDFHESFDDAIPTTDVHGTALDLGVGLEYVHPKFWAGVSYTHLNSPTVTFTTDGGGSDAGASTGESELNYEFQSPATLYFIAGSNIPIKNTLFEVIPSVMVASDFTFTTGQVTGRVRYNKFLSAGVGYRYNDAVSLVLAAEIKGFYIGYSYDYPVSKVSLASSGSHELFAGYSLKLNLGDKNKNKHKSIRIM